MWNKFIFLKILIFCMDPNMHAFPTIGKELNPNYDVIVS